MRSSILLAGAILVLSSCAVEKPCPGGWVTTFLDRGEEGRVVKSGKVCDQDGRVCQDIASFFVICPPDGTFCGDANGWSCLSPGSHFYQLISEKAGAAGAEMTTENGAFELPERNGSDCKARVHVNTAKPRVQLLRCDAGTFIAAANEHRPGTPDAGALQLGD